MFVIITALLSTAFCIPPFATDHPFLIITPIDAENATHDLSVLENTAWLTVFYLPHIKATSGNLSDNSNVIYSIEKSGYRLRPTRIVQYASSMIFSYPTDGGLVATTVRIGESHYPTLQTDLMRNSVTRTEQTVLESRWTDCSDQVLVGIYSTA
jgi:hypothetical protein